MKLLLDSSNSLSEEGGSGKVGKATGTSDTYSYTSWHVSMIFCAVAALATFFVLHYATPQKRETRSFVPSILR